jgi:hypothetical protein
MVRFTKKKDWREVINHDELKDMPDVSGTNSDHDSRYYTETEIDTMFTDGTIIHANLGSLNADDHTHYFNEVRGDARYLKIVDAGTTYVPYTGASANVDLGSYEVKSNQVKIQDDNTIINKDVSGNMTFTDIITGTRTLKNIGCPVYHYIKATGQTGDFSVSDGTNWNVDKALIYVVRVFTNSTDWDLYILQNDNTFAVDDAVIPKMQIMSNGNGNANINLGLPYNDEDASKEVHFYFIDNSGVETVDVIVIGTELV